MPKAKSRMIKLVRAGSGLVMRRSSVITGKPFTPLLGAVSVTAPVTMVSWPALPALQPPTAALVFALVIASDERAVGAGHDGRRAGGSDRGRSTPTGEGESQDELGSRHCRAPPP